MPLQLLEGLYDLATCGEAPLIPGCICFCVKGAPDSFFYHAAIVVDQDDMTAATLPSEAVLGSRVPVVDMMRTLEPRPFDVDHNTLVAYRAQMSDEDFTRASSQARALLRATPTRPVGALGRAPYKLVPHKCFEQDPNNPGEFLGFKGNCAGFVELCYERAGADIVEDDPESKLPTLSLEDIASELAAEPTPSQRTHWGLDGAGPWHVLLPGHQIAAIRARGPFPYRVTRVEDRYYRRG
jgi:hypothetical protein